jgi:hypothetical protein
MTATSLPSPFKSDASGIETYQKCPRRWFIQSVMKRKPAGKAPALDFGSAFHDYIAEVSKAGPTPPHLMRDICAKYNLFYTDDKRNASMFEDTVDKYLVRFPDNDALRIDDKDMVELSFALPITSSLILTGKIDRITPEFKNLDLKTSSMNSSQFWSQWNLSIAQIGYCWASSQLTQRDITQFIIRAIFTYTANRTPDRLFEEREYVIDTTMFKEWKEQITTIMTQMQFLSVCLAEDILGSGDHARWYSCYSHKYGFCPFVGVCQLPNVKSRMTMLQSNVFEHDDWDPTK